MVSVGRDSYFSENNNIQSNLNENEIVNYVDIDAVNNKTFSIENVKEKKKRFIISCSAEFFLKVILFIRLLDLI